MFYCALSTFPSSKQHKHNLHINYLHNSHAKKLMQKCKTITIEDLIYLTASGPGGNAWCGCLITGHMCGNLAHAHNCTNSNAPPICLAIFSDALQRYLYSQLSAALPQLKFFPLLIGLKNYRYD